MANINNTSRKFLRPSFCHWFAIMYSANVTNRFLRPDLPRACPVYEVIQTTIDVPVWGLIFSQVHQLALLDTSDIAPPSTKASTDGDYLSFITSENSCCIDYHTCSHLPRKRIARAKATRIKDMRIDDSRYGPFVTVTRTIVYAKHTVFL